MFLSVVLICFDVARDDACHVISKLLLLEMNKERCKYILNTHASVYDCYDFFALADAYTPVQQTERSSRTR